MRKYILLNLLAISACVMAEVSPYIYRVWEYAPAPGQFVNQLPEYEAGDDANMMRLKAEEAIADDNRGLISLGGWGGYVVFGFDHLVVNRPDNKDFVILGNSFYSEANPNPDARPYGGSAEPGVVWVSYDANGNGKPDDEWYELAGSEHTNPLTRHDYSVTYYRPADSHIPMPGTTQKYITDSLYIRWCDNVAQSGYLFQNAYNTQPYFPEWLDADSLTFSGTRLPDNGVDESGTGSYYVLYAYEYGYADNHPNTSALAGLDIQWAVKTDGTPADLPGIHFVKVQSGLLQQCGWLGETSTEVMGAIDLSMTEDVSIVAADAGQQAVYTIGGIYLGTQVPATQGIYIVRKAGKTTKVIRK